MQTENLSPTTYDAAIAENAKFIATLEDSLAVLKKQARNLRFKAICEILEMEVGDIADFRFPSGKVEQFRLTGDEFFGNAIFTATVQKPSTLGTRCIHLDLLQQGLYDGVNNTIITKAIV